VNILFLIAALSRGAGGAERVLSEVSAELVNRGHAVSVASFDAPGSEDFYPLDLRIARHRLGAPGIGKSLRVRSLVRNCRPDVAVGFMHTSFLRLPIGTLGTGVPIVASEHTVCAHYKTRRGLLSLLRLATSFFAAITVPSVKARDSFPPEVRRKMVIIPNPVTLSGSATSDRGRSARQIVLAAGNLRKEKRHALLIEAFARVAPSFTDWDLHIAGDGPELASLEAQIRSAGLDKRVKLLGPVRDMSGTYAGADIFVVPSQYESFGIATAEALSAGITAIGFADCPGTNEIIADGQNGLLVGGPDPAAALADGLSRLMSSPDERRRLGAAGPARVASYSLDSIVDQWEQLLSNVAAGRLDQRVATRGASTTSA